MRWSGLRRLLACGMPLVVVLLLAPGCANKANKEELPKTYAVHGKVVEKDGMPYRGGGVILFRPIANQELQAYGELAEDGTFALHTLGRTQSGHAENLNGTIEGEFKVQIKPQGQGGKGRPFWLSKTYRVEPNEQNEIAVVLEK